MEVVWVLSVVLVWIFGAVTMHGLVMDDEDCAAWSALWPMLLALLPLYGLVWVFEKWHVFIKRNIRWFR